MRPVVSLILCSFLAGCAAQPAQNTSKKSDSAVDALYTRMDVDTQRYLGASDGGKAGEASTALDDLRAAANACVNTRGCDSVRFVAAFDKLLRERAAVPA